MIFDNKKTIELPTEHANITFQYPRCLQTANGLPVMWYPVSHLCLIPRPTLLYKPNFSMISAFGTHGASGQSEIDLCWFLRRTVSGISVLIPVIMHYTASNKFVRFNQGIDVGLFSFIRASI